MNYRITFTPTFGKVRILFDKYTLSEEVQKDLGRAITRLFRTKTSGVLKVQILQELCPKCKSLKGIGNCPCGFSTSKEKRSVWKRFNLQQGRPALFTHSTRSPGRHWVHEKKIYAWVTLTTITVKQES